ncbi:choice-of-anchor D domain-containing protein, partial [Lacihabitans sp. LS3-19]|uniref:Calx-beta domain-containing protein n=1 Tax=Lacihabitans sp. LS3-19 TaxID=2487335 RepID=UPI0020CC5B8C
ITINSNGGALGSGQTIDANGIVNGLNFIGTPLDGLYFQSLTFNTVDGDGLGGGNGLVYLEIDHVNFTTTVPVTNTYAIANANFSEGNAGTTVNTYTITRSLGTLAGSVQIQSSNGTATAGSDYVAVPLTTVNFPIGSLSQTVNVTINGDVTLEPNETINMTLSNPTGGTISSGSAIITILNDDSFIETFEDETNLANTFTEGGVNFQSTGKLGISKTVSAIGSGSSFGFLDSKAPYATGNQGSIEVTTAGKTFKMLSVDLWSSLNSGNSFPATACTVTFTGLKEDGINTVSHSASISPTGLNGFETVNFTGTPFDNIPLISISFSVSGSVNYLAIDNFNFAPSNITTTQLSINDVSLLEGTLGGNTSAVFTVSRSNNSTAFSVNVTSSNLTASAGSDYTAVNTILNFSSGGSLSQTVSVPIIKDASVESNETFNMTLSNATNGTFYLKKVGLGTINNDDGGIGETFEDEITNANIFTQNSVTFSATGGYKVAGAIGVTDGSGSSSYYLSSNNNIVGNMGTITVTSPNVAFKINTLDAWVGTSSTSFSSGPVTFTGTLFGGGTVTTTVTITATNNTGTGWQQNISFTGTSLDNVLLTAIQVSTGGSLKACDIDNFNFNIVDVSPVIEVTDASNNPITNGGVAGSANNTDFGAACITGGSISKTYTIKNTGSSALILSGSPLAVLGGADAGQFSISPQPTSPIGAGNSATFTVTFDPSSAGVKNATITLTSNDATNNPFVINIKGTGNENPNLTLGTITDICAGSNSFTIPYTATTGTPTTYSISGTGITTVTDASLPVSPITVNLSSAASFGTNPSFTLTVKNATGCTSDNISGGVTVLEAPTLSKNASMDICEGATSFTIPYTATTGSPTTYSISGIGITAVSDATLPASPITVDLSSGASGSGISYILTVKNANGCISANITGSVNVNPKPTLANSASPTICAGATSFTIPYTSTTGTPTTYSVSGTGITTETDVILPASPITVNISDGGGASGTSYSYILTLKNAAGCSSSDITGNVSVNTALTPTGPSASPSLICTSGVVTLSASGCTGTLSWFDASDDSPVSNTPTVSSSKSYYAKCTVGSCVSDASSNVNVTVVTPLTVNPGNVDITWTGAFSNDWNQACNWNPAWVPTETNGKVIIPVTSNNPLISGSTATVKVIDIAFNASLEISTTGVLNVRGNGGTDMGIKVEGALLNHGTLNLESATATAAEVCIYLKGAGNPYFENYGITNINSLTEAFEVGAAVGASILNASGTSEINIKNGIGFRINLPTDNLTLTNHALIKYTGSDLAFSFQGTVNVSNTGKIEINSGTGIVNPLGSSITNQGCAEIIMQSGAYTNGGSTLNLGLIQMPNSYDFSNTGTFTNSGVLKANTILGITNNKLVIENTCPIFTIGGTNDFVIDGIFTDASATSSAGVYTALGNVFVAGNSLPAGSQTLYVKATQNDCGSICTKIVPFDFVNEIPTSVSISQTSICETSSVTLNATCASGTVTWYSSASSTVVLGTGDGFSLTPVVGTAYSYFAACETANCKSSRIETSNTLTVKVKPSAPILTPPASLIVCSTNTLSISASCATGTVLWSDNSTVDPLILSAVGTYTVSAKCVLDGCESDASADVTGLEIGLVPDVPVVVNQDVCSGGNITLATTCNSAGSNPVWFADNLGTVSVNPVLTNVTNTFTYYVACKGPSPTDCQSNLLPHILTVNTPLNYVVQPADYNYVFGCQNSTAEIIINSINIAGSPINYKWQIDQTGTGFVDIVPSATYSGIDKDTLKINMVTLGMEGYKYRVILSNACNTITADTSTLKVNVLPTIITQPIGQTVCVGNQTTLSVVANGSGLSYQWEVNTGSGFVNISNGVNYTQVNTPNLRITDIGNGFNNNIYRCKIFNSCISINSDPAALIVDPTITILGQPINKTVCQNGTVSFNVVSVHLSSGAINYQWQVSTNGGITYSNVSNNTIYAGVQTNTLTLSNIPYYLNNAKFRCLMNNYCQSFGAALSVTPVVTITQNPSNVIICEGNFASFSVVAAGEGLTYRWQVKSGPSFVNILDGGIYQGATSSTLQIAGATVADNGKLYRCVVTGNSSCDVSPKTSLAGLLNVGTSAEALTILAASPLNTGNVIYQAVGYVLGINTISSPAVVEYRAGNAILLNPGFQVETGGVFSAKIQNACLNNVFALPNNSLPKKITK